MKTAVKTTAPTERNVVDTLVCFALNEEATAFRKLALEITGVSILVTGIGRENAGAALRKFLAGTLPKRVFTCGFAGGLNPGLAGGDLVFATGYPELEIILERAGAKPAVFFCADRIATTVAEKKKLRAETGADVVEMESAAILDICRERQIPGAMLRVISDTAGEDLPLDFNALSKPDKSLDFVKLLLAVARSPHKIGALLKLQQKTSLAARKLADALEKVIAP
jgi:adenosylhomocysteine nucleosidase